MANSSRRVTSVPLCRVPMEMDSLSNIPYVFKCAQKSVDKDCLMVTTPTTSQDTTPTSQDAPPTSQDAPPTFQEAPPNLPKASLANIPKSLNSSLTPPKWEGNHRQFDTQQIPIQNGSESVACQSLTLSSFPSKESELPVYAVQAPAIPITPPTVPLTPPTYTRLQPPAYTSMMLRLTPPTSYQALPQAPPSSPASTVPPTPVSLMNMQRLTSTDSSTLAETKSETSLSTMGPVCRICHLPAEETDLDALISPCRCSGSLQFIHSKCLEMWLEYSAKKSKIPPRCELCRYKFQRHKKIKFHRCHCPNISNSELLLHILFFINIIIMIGCAAATVICFVADRGQVEAFSRSRLDLNALEVVTLACGVLFFVSLFTAMLVEIRARRSICQLLMAMVRQNVEWQVDEYDKTKDTLLYKV